MRVVVHGVNNPLRTLPVMRHVHDPEKYGITHVDIPGCHVDFGAKYVCALVELAMAHALEQLQILFDGPVAVWTVLTRFRQSSSIFPNFIRSQAIDVGLAILDED